MNESSMTPDYLASMIKRFPALRVGVIGDFFLDKYMETDPAHAEISLETGKTAHQVSKIRMSPGAAGNVAVNLSALGAGNIHAVGFIGDDGEGYDLTKCLHTLGCSTENLFKVKDRMTPTYLKPRDCTTPGLAGEFERYDTKNRVKTTPETETMLLDSLDRLLPELDALLIVDQVTEPDCGVVTGRIRSALGKMAKRYPDCVFFTDSRSNILSFRNVVIKPNQFELMETENPSGTDSIDSDTLISAIRRAREINGAPIFVTVGAKGIIVSDPESTTVKGVTVPEPTDPTGAGDSVSAAVVLALASGAALYDAAVIGNCAASVAIEKLGECGTCSPVELLERFNIWLSQNTPGHTTLQTNTLQNNQGRISMKQKILYTPSEVSKLIANDDIVIFDVRDIEDYSEGHIPGAVNSPDIFYYLSESTPDGLTELHQTFRDIFSEAGLSREKTAIFYEDDLDTRFGCSCRGHRIISYLGHEKAGVLDGGLNAWIREGLPIDRVKVVAEPSEFIVEPRTDFIATRDDVLGAIDDSSVKLLDNRDRPEWIGESSSPYGIDYAPRKGRIPGAIWIEWYEFMNRTGDFSVFKSPTEIRELCGEHGIGLDDDIIIYCFKGARAANTYVALSEAGFTKLRIYFGSWNEWSRDQSLPIDEGIIDN